MFGTKKTQLKFYVMQVDIILGGVCPSVVLERCGILLFWGPVSENSLRIFWYFHMPGLNDVSFQMSHCAADNQSWEGGQHQIHRLSADFPADSQHK
jgi:hypothetical protein